MLASVTKPGRPRRYETNAQRQRAYRARQGVTKRGQQEACMAPVLDSGAYLGACTEPAIRVDFRGLAWCAGHGAAAGE
jgi:hypothetical protein